MQLEKYDTFLLFTKDRFTSLDKKLAEEIRSMNKSFFFVRSKIDQDIANGRWRKNFNKDKMFRDIKEDCSKHLKGLLSNSQDIFLISSHDPAEDAEKPEIQKKRYEFDALVDAIEDALPQHKRESLILSLRRLSTASIKKRLRFLKSASRPFLQNQLSSESFQYLGHPLSQTWHC